MNYKEELKKCMANYVYQAKHYVKFVEYNTDTSAGHPIKDDDIVRTILKNIELQNKKSVR